MRPLLRNLVSLLFPPRQAARVVETAILSDIHAQYHPQRRGDVVTLLPYQHPLVRAAITEVKFHHSAPAISLLAEVLAEWLSQQPPSLLIPLPLSSRRQRDRGYNQVEVVIRAACTTYPQLPHRLQPRLLARVRDTSPQTSLRKEERHHNVQDAFTITQSLLPSQPVIVLDDVMTTGATLEAAAAALRPHCPTLTLLAFAH